MSNLSYDDEMAYLAGLIDAEGCFNLSTDHNSYRPALILEIREAHVVRRLQTAFGGNTYLTKWSEKHPGWADMHRWEIRAHGDIIAAIRKLKPYLRCKNRQAEIIESVCQHLLDNKRHKDILWLQEQFLLMKDLNKKGVDR